MSGWVDGPSAITNVRVAVVGCGYWGKNLIRNFAELGALDALVDENRLSIEPLIAQHGSRAMTFDDVLADVQINAVAIAAPAAQHHQLARRALQAGKHVFVEKPLALELERGREVCELADRLDLRLMVGHLLQYHPALLALQHLVREGRLGRLQYIHSNRMSLGKIRQEEDVLWSFAPHDVSMILSLLGCEPEEVNAFGSNFLHNAVADVATIHLQFPGGQRAHILVSWLHPVKEHKLVVVGSEAMAVFDDTNDWGRKLLLFPHRVEWKNNAPVPAKADPVPVMIEAREPLRQECLHFLECVGTGATPRTDGREGLRVLSVLTRAADSLRSKHARINTAPPPATPVNHPPFEFQRSDVTIHESAYVDSGVQIGPGTKIWHFSHILSNVNLGRDVVVGQNVVIGPDVTIGDRCKIQNNVSVYKGVTLEDGVFCGPSCVFTNVNNPRSEVERKSEFRPTWVKRGASIGANATIVCGHTIGEYAFVAAGAVVTSDVPAFALVAGVPARRIGWMSRAGVKLGPNLICPESGLCYQEVAPGQLEEIAP